MRPIHLAHGSRARVAGSQFQVAKMVGRQPFTLGLLLFALGIPVHHSWGGEPPPWLPKYDLDIRLDTSQRGGEVIERVTWTNSSGKGVSEIVFNAHAHYTVPGKDIGTLAKTLEILRMSPSDALSLDGPALQVREVYVVWSASLPISLNQGERQTRR